VTLEVLSIYICSTFNQKLYVFELFINDCEMEGCRIKVVTDVRT